MDVDTLLELELAAELETLLAVELDAAELEATELEAIELAELLELELLSELELELATELLELEAGTPELPPPEGGDELAPGVVEMGIPPPPPPPPHAVKVIASATPVAVKRYRAVFFMISSGLFLAMS